MTRKHLLAFTFMTMIGLFSPSVVGMPGSVRGLWFGHGLGIWSGHYYDGRNQFVITAGYRLTTCIGIGFTSDCEIYASLYPASPNPVFIPIFMSK